MVVLKRWYICIWFYCVEIDVVVLCKKYQYVNTQNMKMWIVIFNWHIFTYLKSYISFFHFMLTREDFFSFLYIQQILRHSAHFRCSFNLQSLYQIDVSMLSSSLNYTLSKITFDHKYLNMFNKGITKNIFNSFNAYGRKNVYISRFLCCIHYNYVYNIYLHHERLTFKSNP